MTGGPPKGKDERRPTTERDEKDIGLPLPTPGFKRSRKRGAAALLENELFGVRLH